MTPDEWAIMSRFMTRIQAVLVAIVVCSIVGFIGAMMQRNADVQQLKVQQERLSNKMTQDIESLRIQNQESIHEREQIRRAVDDVRQDVRQDAQEAKP